MLKSRPASFRRHFQLIVCLLAVVFFLQSANAEMSDDSEKVAAAVNAAVKSKHNSLLSQPNFSRHAGQLAELYRLNANRLLWLDAEPRRLESVFALLNNADADGLIPADYDAQLLRQNFQLALNLPPSAVKERAAFDTALSIALLRFANDLHHGRLQAQNVATPASFGGKSSINLPAEIHRALESNTLPTLPERLQPKFPQYAKLKQALADYRHATEPAGNFEPLRIDRSLRLGDSHPQLAQLRQRLIDLKALPAQPSETPVVYDAELQQGVINFQRQNGLSDDGILGQETVAALNQTNVQKIMQLELAMERLRWLPDNLAGPLIVVNIPAFELRAFDAIDAPAFLRMKVIVGKALQNQTPLLLEDMKYLEFMPYWNIPWSIMNKEILPKLFSDLNYLQNQDIELVQSGDTTGDSAWDSIFDDIKRGRLRGRQRPGNKNPLGKVKFVFPNKEDVYLHDTSSPRLFNRNRRDLSHGCVRVAEAEKLAEFVLSRQPGNQWDAVTIQQAMAGGQTRRVALKQPIPVLFFYNTAFVDDNNNTHFYRDIYRQDAELEKALGLKKSPGLITAQTGEPIND